jgi:TolA-binding protein
MRGQENVAQPPYSAQTGWCWSRNFLLLLLALSLFPGCHKNPPIAVAPVVAPTPAPTPRPVSALTLDEANREFAVPNYAAAARDFTRFLDMVPSGPAREDVLFRLGLIYSLPVPELQDWSRAQGFFLQLASEFPSSPWKPVGQLLITLKDQRTALTSEIQTVRSEAAQIQAQLESLRSNSTQQGAQIQQLKDKVDQLNSDIDKKDQKIKDLTNDIQRLIRIDAQTQPRPRN